MSGFDDDDIAKDVAAALESTAPASAGTSSPPADAALPSDPPAASNAGEAGSGGERARGPDGKFVAQPKGGDAPAPDRPEQSATGLDATSPQAGQSAPSGAQPTQDAPVAAPQHWKGNGKVEWGRLPRPVQQALNEDYARIAKADQELQNWSQVIPPERATAFAAQYGSTQAAVKQLLALSDYATRDKPGFIRWFAEQNRIDLASLVQGASQGQQQPAGDPNPYERELHTLRNQVQQLVLQQTQGAQTQVMSEIQAFAADPAHPYFNDVREHMGALMKAGKAGNLQEAYDMATWAVPSVRQTLLEAKTRDAMQANAQKVQQAKQAAAGSLTGSPKGANIAQDEPDTDLEGTVRKIVNALP